MDGPQLRLILASASPRRRELLSRLGLTPDFFNFAGLACLVERCLPSADRQIARAAGVLAVCLPLFFIEHFAGLGSLKALWPLTTLAAYPSDPSANAVQRPDPTTAVASNGKISPPTFPTVGKRPKTPVWWLRGTTRARCAISSAIGASSRPSSSSPSSSRC